MTAKRLLLIVAVLALLVASGVVWAAATATTYAVVQIPLGYTDPGTTWTEGGITHLRGAVVPTIVLYYYDGDAVPDDMTIVELTVNNNWDANGVGTGWGTWSEYDYDTGTVLLGGGTWQAKYTCWEGQDVEEEYAYGWVNPVGWRFGPDGEWGHATGTLILYSEPLGSEYPFVFRGEGRFLVPGGQ